MHQDVFLQSTGIIWNKKWTKSVKDKFFAFVIKMACQCVHVVVSLAFIPPFLSKMYKRFYSSQLQLNSYKHISQKSNCGSQEPVIADLSYSFQNKVYLKTIWVNYGLNITSKFIWGSHLGLQMPNTILKGTHLGTISPKIGSNGVKFQRRKYFFMNFP